MLSTLFKRIRPPAPVRVPPLMSFLLIKGGRHPRGLHLKAAPQIYGPFSQVYLCLNASLFSSVLVFLSHC